MLRPLLQLKTSLNIMKTHTSYEKRTLFINNYLVFSKNYIMPPYKKLQTLISAFIKNLIFGKNRDPCLQLKRDVMLPVCFNPNIFSTGMGKWGVLSIWCNTLLITYLIRTRPHLCGQSWTEGAASLCRLSPLSATKSLLPHISHS